MKLYQPMLYVGLGGTGCQIGIELEKRLREELCGPDGTQLQRDINDSMLPFQLPSFTQFVYADLNEVELARVRRMVVSTEEHTAAAGYTDHFAKNLVPRYDTYPEVARSLRLNAAEETSQWLPPQAGEPRISPLVRGAGQLPTVGRAALFETFRHGFDAVREPLDQAIGRISRSGDMLAHLNVKPGRTCNVFVGFSIAGGTGAGIFYDFLHLIGHQFKAADIRPQIYPLVLMPSAFADGQGGGRRAKLNAAPALLDLFRLVDDQNARGAENRLGDTRNPYIPEPEHPDAVTIYDARNLRTGPDEQRRERISVRYPDPELDEVQLDPSVLQTAFLFSHSVSVEREDLHRSIVSFILSMVGTELEAESDKERASDQMYQSFADGFINEGVDRGTPAHTGVGNRPVSTSLVASMTVPVDELADIISARLLARAVDELAAPPPGKLEQNRPLVDQFYTACGLDQLRTRLADSFREPNAVRGAAAITGALRTRISTMSGRANALPARLRPVVSQMAREFDYKRGVREGLTQTDPFRLRRVIMGNTQAADQADQTGFLGSLERRKAAPPAPSGLSAVAPVVEPFRHRWFRRKLEWSRPEVRQVISRQDRWYKWRAESAWNVAWGELSTVWDPRVAGLRNSITDFADAFLAHARDEGESYDTRTADLHRPRTGVSYLVPRRSDFDQFYSSVVRRFVSRPDLALRPTATEADIVTALLGGEGWRRAYILASEGTADRRYEQAVLHVRNLLKQEIKALFRERGAFGEGQPLLPRLRELLSRAAGKGESGVADNDLSTFLEGIARLLPMSYLPQGTGKLKILVAYPQDAKDPQVEKYLAEQINLPREPDAHKEFRAVDTESIMVVLLRTSMGVTEVPELRDILRHWSDALRHEQPQDFMLWRQRLGYNYRWLATTEADRIKIMQRLLCAMWNDQVLPLGDRDSPGGVLIRLQGELPVEMELRLDPYGSASSWATLMRSYEEWTFSDSERIRQDFCEQLMQTVPHGLEFNPVKPSKLYEWFIDVLVPRELALLDRMLRTAPVRNRSWVRDLRDFWKFTVPAATAAPFYSAQQAMWSSIDELESHFLGGDNLTGGPSQGRIEGPGEGRGDELGDDDPRPRR